MSSEMRMLASHDRGVVLEEAATRPPRRAFHFHDQRLSYITKRGAMKLERCLRKMMNDARGYLVSCATSFLNPYTWPDLVRQYWHVHQDQTTWHFRQVSERLPLATKAVNA